MAKKSSAVKPISVRGGDDDGVDERGKFRNRDAEEGSRGKNLKKKKKKVEAKEPFTIEDNTYKVGQEPTEKKKKKKSKDGSLLKEVKDLVPASPAALKKAGKGKQMLVEAIEEYAALPAPADEFDEETRRIFEQLVSLASRLEEQMEDRIYNKDVYALNTIYSQIREVIADLRASRDITAQVQQMEVTVLKPYHMEVAQQFTNIYFHMHGALTKNVADEDLREEILKKLKNSVGEAAEMLTQDYTKAVDRIGKVLM